jgi:hypothetical protein
VAAAAAVSFPGAAGAPQGKGGLELEAGQAAGGGWSHHPVAHSESSPGGSLGAPPGRPPSPKHF